MEWKKEEEEMVTFIKVIPFSIIRTIIGITLIYLLQYGQITLSYSYAILLLIKIPLKTCIVLYIYCREAPMPAFTRR